MDEVLDLVNQSLPLDNSLLHEGDVLHHCQLSLLFLPIAKFDKVVPDAIPTSIDEIHQMYFASLAAIQQCNHYLTFKLTISLWYADVFQDL